MMTKTDSSTPVQSDLFKVMLSDLVAKGHELVLLRDAIDWKRFEDVLAPAYCSDNGVISGTATKSGKFTVMFTLSKKIKSGKKTTKLVHRATATFNVSGLPDWAVGTFSGSTLTSYDDYAGYYEPGMIKATIGATGKISGYYSVGGDKTKFSGSGFTHSGATEIAATVKGKVDGKTKSFKLTIKPTLAVDGNGTNVVVGAASFKGNIAKDENIATELLDQNLWTHPASASMRLPSLPEGELIECGSSDTGRAHINLIIRTYAVSAF